MSHIVDHDAPKPKAKAQKSVPTVEELTAKATAARDRWLAAYADPEKIEEEVEKLLRTNLDEVIVKVFGLDNHWFDKWEVDHCNGRAGNSFLGQEVQVLAARKAGEWFAKAIEGMNLEPSKAQIKAIKDDVLEQVNRRIDSLIQDYASGIASQIADSVFAEVGQQISDEAKVKARRRW